MKKKHASKRLLALLLALILALGMLPGMAWAADDDLEETRTVYVTISLDGEFVKDEDGKIVAQRRLEVPMKTDVLTINDVMIYAHEALAPNDMDYAFDETAGTATKLWGATPADGQTIMFGNTAGHPNKPLTSDINLEISEDYWDFQLSAAIFSNEKYTSRFIQPKVNMAFMGQPLTPRVFVMEGDTPLQVDMGLAAGDSIGANPAATLTHLEGYEVIAYDLDGELVNTVTGTVSDPKGQVKITFSQPGDYVISAKKTVEETKTVSPPACRVTVLDEPPVFETFEVYTGQDRTYPLSVTPLPEGDGYVVAAPENWQYLYPVFSLNAYSDILHWSSGSSQNRIGEGVISRTTQNTQTISIVNKWDTTRILQTTKLVVKHLPPLASLTVEGYEQNAFDPQGASPYRLYIRADQTSVDITPVAKDAACSVMVEGVTGTSGQTFTVPVSKLSFDDNNRAEAKIVVHAEGEEYVDNTYTVILEKQPQEDAPTILEQPADADYIVGKEAKPLIVYASASGPLSYQWYRNTENKNEDGTLIEGATAASYIPPTAEASAYYYYCLVTNTQSNLSTVSNTAYVAVDNEIIIELEWDVEVPDLAPEHSALLEGQTKGFYYRKGDKNVTPLTVKATCDDPNEGGTWKFSWLVYQAQARHTATTATPSYTPKTDEAYGPCQVICRAEYTNAKGVKYEAGLEESIFFYVDKAAVDYSAVNAVLSGTGTAQNPWKLANQADLTQVRNFVAQGVDFENTHFIMTKDITLDGTWDSMGTLKSGQTMPSNGVNIIPFSGNLDGGGYTLTYAEGTSKPLFRYVREASVRNMNIYAPNFKGVLLVSDYVVDYGNDGSYSIGGSGSYALGCPDTIDIENVTVKSGTWMSGGAFISGSASGGNIINIRNCVVEPGVTMGKDKDTGKLAGNVSSFSGGISGTIINCVSYADLYSSGSASGIATGKSQSMGPFLVLNCGFLGSITGGGGYVGGIIGYGYAAESAPNTPCVQIQNCYVGATLKGSGKIGGIFGGEPYNAQTWAPAYIRNNVFYGKIEPTGDNATVGAIVGYMYGLNKHNIITNNFYVDDCGAQRSVGGAHHVDTSAAHETSLGIHYFNTAGGKSAGLPLVGGYDPAPKTNMNRTDDPFGKDSAQLGRPVTRAQLANGTVTALLNKGEGSLKNWAQGEDYPIISEVPVAYDLTVSGTYKSTYYIGDSLDLSGIVFTAKWSDGTVTTPSLEDEDLVITGFDSSKRAVITLAASYGAAQTQFAVTVLQKVTPKDTITVSFVLLGDDHHDSVADKEAHTLIGGGLTTWIKKKDYTVDINATVETVFRKALEEAGIKWEGTADNQFKSLYISGVQNPVTKKMLSEFDNGPRSGWMYTVNGKHPDIGVAAKFLEDGDRIVFHYTDDYTKEEGSEQWSGGTGDTAAGSTTLTPKVTAKDGVAAASVSGSDMSKAIEDAKKSDSGAIVIAPEISGKANKTSVELPKSSLSSIASDTNADLIIVTPTGSVTIPNDALASVASQAGGSTVTVVVEAVEAKALTAEQQKTAGDNPVFDISILSGGKPISSFGGKSLTISLPYTLKAEESADGVTVWYLNDADELKRIACKYDKATGLATFTTDHLSHYIVGYDAWQNPFTDVKAGDWYYDAVKYAVHNELFTGTSGATFSPNADMTRAMLVTVLYRLEGKPAVTGTNSFADVKSGEWYTDAVIWANAGGIVTGYDSKTFGTNDPITREQMAAILYRYAQMKNYDVTKTTELTKFTDAASISSWADTAMKWAVAEGLVSGTSATTLTPASSAARAQVATILMRFMENVAK